MTSAMLKRSHDEGAPPADQPLLAWAFHARVHKLEESLSAALRNGRNALAVRSAGAPHRDDSERSPS
ncbi:hypothetical protein G6F24_016159 [Rhizopus arrhizus]|nr:hypothetical protein G6F24_016159 [Rhizopus arrhizus]